MINQGILKRALSYNPETGIFIWLERSREHFPTDRIWKIWSTLYSGKLAGSKDKFSGYLTIWVDGKLYFAHRLAFLYMTGEFPPKQTDHKNHGK